MGLGIYKKIKNIRPYRPIEYWKKRGKVYEKEFVYSKNFRDQEKMLLDVLKQLSFVSILECGCGFGRITKLILDNFSISEYHAFDLSSHQIDNARKNCQKFDNVHFEVSTIQDFKSEKKFDLVLSVEVLLHILPRDIDQIITKMVNLSKRDIINLDWYEKIIPPKIEPHNFIHQYPKLYSNTQMIQTIKQYSINNKQSIFHAQRKS